MTETTGNDLKSIMMKGIAFAEQAVAEDKAGNYEIASKAYLTAAEWIICATKYGVMSAAMKQQIRDKVKTYLKRAEEVKAIADKKRSTNQIVSSGVTSPVDSKFNNHRDDNDDNPEKKRIIQKFESAIVSNSNVTFDDVIGLEQAKTALKEAVILPVMFPKLVQDKRKPCTGILLYGPPGTGKSYLAKAIATECKSTFISISSSDPLFKWLSESIRGVKWLFEFARERQPCIVFIDEFDTIFGLRYDTEPDPSRRAGIEFVIQMYGVETDNAGVLILAATNTPWTLENPMRRRFKNQIYVSLPGVNERAAMFKIHLGTNNFHTIQEHEWMQLAQKAEHYSGADIAAVCREALLKPIRQPSASTHLKNSNETTHVCLTCSSGDSDGEPITLDTIRTDELCDPPITLTDMLDTLATRKLTVDETDLLNYQKFTEEFGQEGS